MPIRKPAPKRQPMAKPKAALPPAPMPPKRGRGRPRYVPADEQAAGVRALVAAGVRQDRICGMLNISLTTFRKHFKYAIQVGQAHMDALSISTLLHAMRGGGMESVAAAKWWTQSRMGWRARTTVDDGKSAATATRVIVELVG